VIQRRNQVTCKTSCDELYRCNKRE
jgi:hypothetical protein